MRERLAWLVLGAVLGSGCSGSTDTSAADVTPPSSTPAGSTAPTTAAPASEPTPTPTAPPPGPPEEQPPTPAELKGMANAEALIGEDGKLSMENSLAAFSALFEPLPGIEPAATPLDGRLIAGAAYHHVVDHYDSLTPEQQAVVGRVKGPAGVVVDLGDGPGGAKRPAHSPRQGLDANLERGIEAIQAADRWLRTRLTWRLPRSVAVNVVVLPEVDADGTRHFAPGTSGDAVRVNVGIGPLSEYRTCEIRLNSDFFTSFSISDGAGVHELFHCYQSARLPAEEGVAWVREGTAAWVTTKYAGVAPFPNWWWGWIVNSNAQLFRRAYSAIGFYYLLERNGVDLWAVMEDLVRDQNIDLLADAVDDADQFYRQFGTHFANRADWGVAFDVLGEGSPSLSGASAGLEVPANPTGISLTTPVLPVIDRDWRAEVRAVKVNADVLRVVANDGVRGGLRIGSLSIENLAGVNRSICVRPGGCTCPSRDRSRDLEAAGGDTGYLGVGPSESGARVLMVGQRLDEFCNGCAISSLVRRSGGFGRSRAPMQGGGVCRAPATETTTTVAIGIDACIVGSWSSTRWFGTGAAADAFGSGGTGFVTTFGADGRFSGDFSRMTPLVNRQAGPENGEPIEISLQFSGGFSGAWGSGDDGRFSGSADTSGIRVRGTVTVAGQTIEAINKTLPELAALAGGAGGSSAGVYNVSSCSGEQLTLQTNFNGGAAGIEFTRVG